MSSKLNKINPIKIENNFYESEFYNHLKLEGNKRILFTGPFGMGKSTFLNQFFMNHKYEYFTIKLYPVNYSVSQNEDVFELIKFDIILQLMGDYKDDANLVKEDFSMLLASQQFILERLDVMPIFNAILSLAGKLGKSATEFLNSFKSIIQNFKEYQDEIKIDEFIELENYCNSIIEKSGTKYEMDDISLLIKSLIKRVKEKKSNEGNVKSILIVDDLDRLDPEHVFRLFNVFSAHFDDINIDNKFGFDSIIFVCDFDNIWKLLRHKYGYDVDFKGYIDKFYSFYPFKFDNRREIKKIVDVFITKIKAIGRNGSKFKHLSNLDYKFDFYLILRWILLALIESKLLNLRTIISDRNYNFPEKKLISIEMERNGNEIEMVLIFSLLEELYSSIDYVHECLKNLKNRYNEASVLKAHEFESYDYESISQGIKSYCLPLLFPEIGFLRDIPEQKDNELYLSHFNAYFHYEVVKRDGGRNYDRMAFIRATRDKNLHSEQIKISDFQMLLFAFEKYIKLGGAES